MRQTLEEHVRATEGNAQFVLNLAINYGARAEIVDAVRSIARDVRDGRLAPDDVTEDLFSDRLYTGGLPDPDLLIRTGGDMRISNFLLWQLAYTEFYITPTLWPDFDEAGLDEAFQAFRGRERRYGGVLGDAG
jgi:undecaprenyl diphosphate synthase